MSEPRLQALSGSSSRGAVGEWPDPILPGHNLAPEIPVDVLPNWLAEFAQKIADSTQVPTALPVMSMIATLSTILQRRFEVAPFSDSYTEPLSIWCLAAADSGSRKTEVLKATTEPLATWEKRAYDRMRPEIFKVNAERAVAKKRIEKLTADAAKLQDAGERARLRAEIEELEATMPAELRAPKLFTSDINAERLQALMVEHGERMGLHSDESGVFGVMAGLYSGGAANIDAFLQAHAGSSMRVERMGRSAYIDRAALAVNLAIQPSIMAEVAGSNRFRGAGLLARFLFVVPPAWVGKRDVRRHHPLDQDARDAYRSRMITLLEGQPAPASNPKVLTLSDAARELWLDLAQEVENQIGDGKPLESIRDWCAKLPGAAARLAAIFELAETGLEAEVVHEDHMLAAVGLAWHLVPHAQNAFALLGADAVDSDAQHVLAWIRGKFLMQFTRREAHRALEGRFRNVDRLQRAMDRLEACDIVRKMQIANVKAPATTAFKVNPKLFGASTLSGLS